MTSNDIIEAYLFRDGSDTRIRPTDTDVSLKTAFCLLSYYYPINTGTMKTSILIATASYLLKNSLAFVPQKIVPVARSAILSLEAEDSSRRGFLGSASIFAGCNMLGWPVVPPAFAADVDYKAVAADIKKLIAEDPDKVCKAICAVTWLRNG